MVPLSHNVKSVKYVRSPSDVFKLEPLPAGIKEQTIGFRTQLARILTNDDYRRIVILGPCSIHDTEAGLEYANLVKEWQKKLPHLLLVMRVYFEKPRTTTGWKGFINDPNLDGSFDINLGLLKARDFLIKIAQIGVPTATEFLDPFTPNYFRHLFSWGAIGARTLESQIHRELASGLPMPIGFKNSTGGNSKLLVNAIKSARSPHSYLGIDSEARLSIMESEGNPYAHTVLRGCTNGPNYNKNSLMSTTVLLQRNNVSDSIIVDCSHDNCDGDYKKQYGISRYVFAEIRQGHYNVKGVMLESFLEEGRQSISDSLTYGKSITDPCLGKATTASLLIDLNGQASSLELYYA